MDSIKAVKGLSPYMGQNEHLSIYINGVRFDEMLSKINESYRGLIPAWLDYYDREFAPSMREKQYVLEKTKLSDEPTLLPIMLCPDDFDFSCTVITVEVICEQDTVIWKRFGIDTTPFDSNETELPKCIGKEITWFCGIGPFVFAKSAYMQCIAAFAITQ